MSVESEILRIQHNIANAYAAVSEKGGEVPLQPTSANLAQAVASIPAGSSITPGDGLSQDGNTINVSTPVRGIVSWEEWNALSEDEQSKGFWIIKSGEGGHWFSPKLTDNNAPEPYAATASSNMPSYGSSGAFAAFDENPETYWCNYPNETDTWIAFDFGTPQTVDGLQMQGRVNVNQLPYTFVVQGSNDGTEWADILSKSDLPVDTPGEIRSFDFPEPVTYRHYRVANMLSHWQDGPTFVGIADIRFHVFGANYVTFVINGATVEIPDQEAIPDTPLEVYSTEEQKIGTWIDGKPLYRRVYSITLPSTSGIQTIISLPSDIDVQFLKARGYDNTVRNTVFYTGTNYSAGTFDLWYKPNTHVIEGQIGSQLYGMQALVVLEYTKTTDTAAASLSAQSGGTIELSTGVLDLSSIPSAPVTAAEAGIEINKMEV